MERVRTHFPPYTTRSRVVLEVASELAGTREWPYPQARIDLRTPGSGKWSVRLFGSEGPEVIDEVARGEVQVAVINPVSPLALAYRGTGPFKQPIPLRIIAVVPSPDQFAFGVAERTGIKSLEEIRDRRYPLKVSLRGARPDHSLHFILRLVLEQAGFSLDDIKKWGGEVRYDKGLPDEDNRMGAVARGEVDAIFDEAVNLWMNPAVESGMKILSLSEPLLKKLEAMGLRRGIVPKAKFPKLPADIVSLDFSGWALYTHANVPDNLIRLICAALETRKDSIPWEEEGPLPVERMCRDSEGTPLYIPLHPAAERFWRERGYI